MKKEEFIGQLERFAALIENGPPASTLLKLTLDQLKAGEPPWWRNVAAAWEIRRFASWNEPCLLYLTALHYAALGAPGGPLAACYPSCGGKAGADPAPGLTSFLDAPPPSFFDNLRSRTPCQYWGSLSTQWVPPALLFFQRKRGMPFYLIDAEAGAGLNLAADITEAQPSFDSELVAARIGLDRHPLDLERDEDRRWLCAGNWYGSAESAGGLNAAVAALQKQKSATEEFLQLVACPPEKAAEFISKNVPSDDPGTGLLLLNVLMTSRMNDADYAAYADGVGKILEEWGDRGLWVEIEKAREADPAPVIQVRVHRIIEGKLRSLTMAQIAHDDPAPAFSPAADAFLAVK